MAFTKLYNKYGKKPLKLYWWRYEFPDKLNFGDELTPLVISRLSGRRCVWAEPQDCDIAGAGSIIEILQSLSAGHELGVWGSGFIKEGPANTHKNLRFYAVRGKLTLSRLDNPEGVQLGDPGLLMSLAYPDFKKSKKKYKIGLLPHYVDQKHPVIERLKTKPGYKIIDALSPPDVVAQEITECEIIFSSSLHGLILSDSYGVPNYWMPLSNQVTGGDYKFRDYCSVFGETPKKIDALKIKELNHADLIEGYSSKKDLDKIQNNLLRCMPV